MSVKVCLDGSIHYKCVGEVGIRDPVMVKFLFKGDNEHEHEHNSD